MRLLKRIPTKVTILLILLLASVIAYGGWRVSQLGVPAATSEESINRTAQRGSAQRRNRNDDDREFETDLMESFARELDEADDLDRDDRDAAYEILREADPIWKRVKQQNRNALRRANQRPRIVPPTGSGPVFSDQDE